MTLAGLFIVVSGALLALLVIFWLVATRVHHRLQEASPVMGPVRRTVQVTAGCAETLRQLSDEPVLLKLESGVLRYQVGKRPLAPAMVAPGAAAAALKEVGGVLVSIFGARWVAIVKVSEHDSLTVDRLA
jgi:hypothetical protein